MINVIARVVAREHWEIIADDLSKAGWSWGCVSIWIADAHRDYGKRFVVRAEEKLTAFIELESAIRERRSPVKALALPCWER